MYIVAESLPVLYAKYERWLPPFCNPVIKTLLEGKVY